MSTLLRDVWRIHLPSWMWLVAPGAALIPVWRWYLERLTDGSDDPLGIIALAALLVIVIRDRTQFSQRPRTVWLVSAVTLTSLAVLGHAHLPNLLGGVLAILALSSALFAVRSPTRPMLATVGLGLLALPLLSSLQYFVGFPLRVVTAEASAWLLGLVGQEVIRNGSALAISGQLVMVDAPCSGIQMGWMAYFTACSAAAWLRITDACFIRRLPLVGLIVLLGNIVRNTVLVMKEAGIIHWPDWTHEAVGVLTFSIVCIVVLRLLLPCSRARLPIKETPLPLITASKATPRSGAHTLTLTLFVALTLWPYLHPAADATQPLTPFFEWPAQYEGQPLRPLSLSAVEQRFAENFPGTIGRFQTADSTLVLRQVNAPTRMLHPASDCFRGLGYRISQIHLVRDVHNKETAPLQRCFIADNNRDRLQVCEHIIDAAGAVYTDTSSWYWAALIGQSKGPWQAITQARPM